MKLAAPKNPNYCATVVALDKFVTLPNCDNVKGAIVQGNHIIVGKECQPGDIGLYFPLECQLSHEFVSHNNLYRKAEWGNVDPLARGGFFEQSRRVKAVKFRGHKSEGFWIPQDALSYLNIGELPLGSEFDTLGDHEICRKYVPAHNPASTRDKQGRKAPRIEDRIVDGQFHFHVDTEQLRKNVHRINPWDIISITDKWHGTSAVYANVLCKRPLSWFEKLLKLVGVRIQDTCYEYIWSSRRVVKGIAQEERHTAVHFYPSDIWGIVGKEVFPVLPKGVTVYGEIVGYTPEGSPIQPGYHYGCEKGSHLFIVYRITHTDTDGQVTEYSWPQIKEACEKWGLHTVVEHYYGKASKFCTTKPGLIQDWQSDFLQDVEKEYLGDLPCIFNNNEVPAEGVVVKADKLYSCEPFKIKNFAFLKYESDQLDKGTVDIETAESDPQDIKEL